MPTFKKAIIQGLVTASLLSIIPISIIAASMLYIDLPNPAVTVLSYSVIAWFCYYSTYTSAQIFRSKGILQGLSIGILAFTAALILSLIINGFYFTSALPIKLCLTLIFGVIGGVTGVNTKKTEI